MKVKFSTKYQSNLGHLTPEKGYEVIPESSEGNTFKIIDDDGDEIVCRWGGCAHLGDIGIWEKVE